MTTPIDDRVEPPEQPRTIELPAVPDWAVELIKSVKSGFVAAEERFDRQDATLLNQDTKLDKVVTEGIEANVRLDRIEVRVGKVEDRVDTVEGRVGRTSTRVREGSEHDLGRDAKLAEVIVWRADVNAKLANTATKDDVSAIDKKIDTAATAQTQAIIAGVQEVAKNPMVRMIGYALGGLVLQMIGVATAYFALKGHT